MSQEEFEAQGDQWKSDGIVALAIVLVCTFFLI
jgi:hypothetical protein